MILFQSKANTIKSDGRSHYIYIIIYIEICICIYCVYSMYVYQKIAPGWKRVKERQFWSETSFFGDISKKNRLALYTEACKRMIVCSSTELGCFKDCILSRVTLEDYTRRVSASRWRWMVLKIGARKFLCPISWGTRVQWWFLALEKFQGCTDLGPKKLAPFFGLVIFKKGFRKGHHQLQE